MNVTTIGSLQDETFIHLFERIWYSLDDVIVSIGVWLVAMHLAHLLHRTMRSYFRTSVYVAQAAHFIFCFRCVYSLSVTWLGVPLLCHYFKGFPLGLAMPCSHTLYLY